MPAARVGERLVRTPGAPPLTPLQAAGKRAIDSQRVILADPYHSSIKFYALAVGVDPGPYVYVIPAGTKVRAFSYAQREVMNAGGFVAGDGLATPADTNLAVKGQTISGEAVEIYGLSVQILAGAVSEKFGDGVPAGEYLSDMRLVALLNSNVSVKIGLNADKNLHEIGIITMCPGAGGIRGGGVDTTAIQPLEGMRPTLPFAGNGNELRSNFFPMPAGLIWQPQGKKDGLLNVLFEVEREIVMHSGQPWDPQADEIAGALVRGYEYPDVVLAVFKVFLHGRVVSDRSAHA